MRNKLTVFVLFFASFLSAQTSSFVTDRLRAAEYFRIGANSSQKVTGFNTSISGAGSNEKLPTTKAVVDYLTAGFVPINYYTEGAGIDITGGVISNTGDLSATNELNIALYVTGSSITLDDAGGSVTMPISQLRPHVYSAGTGISINNGTGVITNTAPDQTVSIAAGTGIGVTGTYPNFTVTNSAPPLANTALGTGFTSGGGTGTIPAATATIGETQILFAVDAPDQFKVISSPTSDPGATGFVEVVNGTVNFYANLGSVDKSVNMVAVGSGLSFTARNAGMDFTASRSEAVMSFISIPGNLVYDNTVETVKFTDNRATPIGIEYAADYSATIITNPTSFTDVTSVNLLKQTPVSYDDASAPNNCIFYSTTLSKLAYKDPGGTVNPLY